MHISIILSTYNNVTMLQRTLESFTALEVPPHIEWECVVVANACTDNSFDVIQSFADRIPILAVKEPTPGISHGRNAGIQASSGELIVWADDDIQVESQWLTEYWSAYQVHKDTCFFGGPADCEYESERPDPAAMKYAPCSVKGFRLKQEEHVIPEGESFIGANWAVSRKTLVSVGGFDTRLGLRPGQKHALVGEETELMNRLRKAGYKALYLPQVVVVHWVTRQKAGIDHILARWRSYGYYEAIHEEHAGRCLAGVPLWMIKEWVEAYVGWLLARRDVDARARLAFIGGRIDGARAKQRL